MRGDLIKLSDSGLYCPAGGFHIDPWKPVKKAIITHAHSDHAYPGSRSYLASEPGAELVRTRLGPSTSLQTLHYGEQISLNGVKVSFHPAGHVLGSAQIRIERRGEIWVVSGDYKLTPDPTCTAFEPVRCHFLITEATFALPIYRWPSPKALFEEINNWWRSNREQGRTSVMFAYSLGKAQRILAGVDAGIGGIYTHGAVERVTEAYRRSGVDLPDTVYVGDVEDKKRFRGSLVVAPPSAMASAWLKRFGPDHSTAFASGWMMVRGTRRRRSVDRGFVMSDHADWEGLVTAIGAAGAEKVFVTHGFVDPLVRWLNETGQSAAPLKTALVSQEDDL